MVLVVALKQEKQLSHQILGLVERVEVETLNLIGLFEAQKLTNLILVDDDLDLIHWNDALNQMAAGEVLEQMILLRGLKQEQ